MGKNNGLCGLLFDHTGLIHSDIIICLGVGSVKTASFRGLRIVSCLYDP